MRGFFRRGVARIPLYPALVASVLLVCALLIAFDGWRTWQARSVQVAADTAETANLARSLAQHAHDTVQAADTVVVGVRQMAEAGSLAPERLGDLQRLMALDAAALPVIHALSVFDAAGRLLAGNVAGTPGDADRDCFRRHRDSPDRGVLVGGPVRSGIDGRWIVTVSRRLDAPDGSFAGVALATLSTDAMQAFYATFDVGRQGIITLLTADGVAVARQPPDRAMIGTSVAGGRLFQRYLQHPSAGSLEYLSTLDGLVRLGSYRQVEGFPLMIVVAHGLEEALADWRRDARLHLALSLGVAALLAWLGSRFAGKIRDHQRAEQRYRLLADHSSDAILCVRLDGRPLYVSPAFATLTGWHVGSTARDWTCFVHPEDRGLLYDVSRQLVAGSGQAVATYRYVCRNGSHLWAEARCVLVPATDGQRSQFVASIRDITERRLAEERLADAHRELAAQATTDGLTGVANRRRLDEALEHELRRAARDLAPVSLLMIDVDCFKAYNDRYGHPQGDSCLRAVAAAIAHAVRRPGDLVARYGGEEFAVVLADTEASGAAEVAERIRAAVQALALEHAGNVSAACVTASIGAATTCPLTNGAGTMGAVLVARADAALYGAKRAGRNRVETWLEPARPHQQGSAADPGGTGLAA